MFFSIYYYLCAAMKNTNQLWIVLFFILGIIEIYGAQTNTLRLVYIFKPLLLSILGWYFYPFTKMDFSQTHRFFLKGIFYSLLGDTFSISDGSELLFILGFGFFLFTHLFVHLFIMNSIVIFSSF